MKTWQERVIKEKEELLDKLHKLGMFLDSENFNQVAKDERERLYAQFWTMKAYYSILLARINHFE